MAEIVRILGNDGAALVGCAVALVTSGALMCLSYYVRRILNRNASSKLANSAPAAIPVRICRETESPQSRKAA